MVTDVGDAKRIVGDAGYVVPPRNPEALAAAWQGALDANRDEKAMRGRMARERVMEHFSLKRLLEETLRILETVERTGVFQAR